jgi:hypothetical protein
MYVYIYPTYPEASYVPSHTICTCTILCLASLSKLRTVVYACTCRDNLLAIDIGRKKRRNDSIVKDLKNVKVFSYRKLYALFFFNMRV